MRLDWLFGTTFGGSIASPQPRVLDIDVVVDIHRILAERSDGEVAKAEAMAEADGPERTARYAAMEEADERRPRVIIRAPRPTGMGMEHTDLLVPVDEVRGLSRHDRSLLVIEGAGLYVEFRRWHQPTIAVRWNGDANEDLVDPISALISKEGRRQVQWKTLTWVLPLLGAAVVTGLGVWATWGAPLSFLLFTASLLGRIWVAAVLLSKRARYRFARFSTGHCFREVGHADFRDRLTNLRANAVITITSGIIGTIIGIAIRGAFPAGQ